MSDHLPPDAGRSVVETPLEAAAQARPPLLVRRPLEALLRRHALVDGPIEAQVIGEGQSNVTFLVRSGDRRMILRRPPRPPADPDARDVLREARILRALADTPARAPRVLLTCDDVDVLGAPFYVMEELVGSVITRRVPEVLDDDAGRDQVADELVDALVELHAIDVAAPAFADLGNADGFLERQLRTWGRIWRESRTREVAEVEAVARWLAAHLPATTQAPALVHGDYRLGNVMFAERRPARLLGILDWEITTLGDPLCDVGWMLSTWPEPGDDAGPLLSMAGANAQGGFPSRAELVERYGQRSGRPMDDVGWYVVYAYWRAAIGLETLRARARDGRDDDPFLHELAVGVPELAGRARAAAAALS